MKKAASLTKNGQTITQGHYPIPKQGFIALHHLLYAIKALQNIPEWPSDSQTASRLLMGRIERELARLEMRP